MQKEHQEKHEYTDQNAWNDMEISNILHTEGIEKTREELIAMARAAKPTPEAIAGYQKLKEALQNSGLITSIANDLAVRPYRCGCRHGVPSPVSLFLPPEISRRHLRLKIISP